MDIEKITQEINDNLKLLRQMTYKQPEIDIYEFYHGDELIMVGTLRQISDYTMYAQSTLLNYSYPSYLNSPKRGKNAPKLYKVGDSDSRK